MRLFKFFRNNSGQLLGVLLLGLIVVGLSCTDAFAASKVVADPNQAASGKFAEVYTLVVQDMLQGFIGTVVVVIGICFSAIMMLMARVMPALFGLVGSALVLLAPKIATSLGAVII